MTDQTIGHGRFDAYSEQAKQTISDPGYTIRIATLECIRLEKELAEANKRLKQFEWKPIETAPREGNILLLQFASDFVAPGGFFHDELKEDGWRAWIPPFGFSCVQEPVYWMPLPLPKPPEE